ncbi:hypothetical protein NDU88_001268 [Pleurodeles waltl]|uniref:Uncharacterized protein n=1 Tax=Pleurodeles waltl TaxID=8319 RepID=A0AAV7R992_PLEWA|nr:hypothetical protein NDU88_001268 [Pleurodeles waltl]
MNNPARVSPQYIWLQRRLSRLPPSAPSEEAGKTCTKCRWGGSRICEGAAFTIPEDDTEQGLPPAMAERFSFHCDEDESGKKTEAKRRGAAQPPPGSDGHRRARSWPNLGPVFARATTR